MRRVFSFLQFVLMTIGFLLVNSAQLASAASIEKEADELSLVRSGLQDTMCEAYQEKRHIWRFREDVPDLRTAAYVLAIGR